MADKRAFKKLPEVLQTNTLDKFFKSTIDQWFSDENVLKISGYVGRKDPISYDPKKDFYLPEVDNTRQNYQLEPVLITKDIDSAVINTSLFYDDTIKTLSLEGSNVDNHNRLFKSKAYSWAPPIDIDKFVNYENYYWYEPAELIRFDVIQGSTTLNITTDIIGKKSFTSHNGVQFTNGLKVRFVGDNIAPTGYLNKDYIVEGVGNSIRILDVTLPVLNNTRAYTTTDATDRLDYITIKRGSVDENPWSRTNGWYHKDVLLRGTGTSTGTTYTDIIDNPFDKIGDDWDEVSWDATVTQKATEFALDAKRQAVRPIIEFDNNLILHDYGIESAGLVTFASTQTYDMVNNASNVTIDGIDVATDDTLIFLNASNLLSFIKWDGEKLVNATTGDTEGVWDSTSWDIDATSGANNLGKIYKATVASGVCTLVEIKNILTEQKILITKGDERKGFEYHWDGSDWGLSQSKTKTNDEPLFQLWDLNKIKLDDIGTYPNSSFAGNKIFSYNESETGTADTVLGKILNYKEFGQTADIVFQNNLEDTITWGPEDVYKVFGYKYYNQYNLNREIGDVTFIDTVDLVEDTLSYNALHGKLLSQISEFDDVTSYAGLKIILLNNTENYTSAYWDIEEWDDDTPAESWAQQTDLPLLSGQTGIYTITIDTSEGISRVLLNLTTTINHGDYVTISDGILFSGKDMTWQTGAWTEVKFKIPPATRIQNSYGNSWNPTNAFNKQRVVEKYKSDVDGTQEYMLQTTPVTNSPADVIVTVDGEIAKQSTTSTAYDYNIDGNKLTFTTNKILSKDQLIEVKSFTKDAVNLNDIHYFEVPDSLEANPDNNDVSTASGAELQDHFVSIIDNQVDFSGSSLGINNYRDTESDRSKGSKILQHESSMLPLMSVIVNNDTFQVLDAIRFNQRQYVNFKNKFLQTAEFLLTRHLTTPTDVFVDTVLKDMYSKRSNLKNFQDTKAFAFGDNFIKTDVTVAFNADHIDLTELIATSGIDDRSRIIYIYRKRVAETEYELLQQITDYTFATTVDIAGNTVTRIVFPNEVKKNDKIQIRIFEDIQNSFIPPTPSMMGMYQVYRPHIESDGTYIGSSKDFIVGHDGSRTLVYDDYRDQILLELEQRIYNAIPSKFVSIDYLPEINDYEYSPGKFRENDYSLTEFNRILEPIYQRWSVENKVDTFTHRDFDDSLPFTWNYAKEPDKDGKIVPGAWRGIYLYYYDTHRPHTHPWEMLGFTIKPTWWDAQYGDTTENNTALWSDLEAGIIRAGARENYADNSYLINNPFKRTGLSNFIPVNNSSELKDPVQAGIFGDPTVQVTASGYTVPHGPDRHLPWSIGDLGPAEFSIRLNSIWPFIVNKLAFLTRPAEWATKNWDTLNLSRASAQKAQVIFNDTNKRKKLSELRFHQLKLTDTSTTTEYVFGYQQWIYNLLVNQGIDFETAFANNIKTASVNLGYKVGGFVNNNTVTIQADSYSTTRDSDNIFIPIEDKTVTLYNSASEGIRSYSGVIVEITSTGYRVFGYDPYNPVFRIIPSVTTGPKKTIDIEEVRVFEYTSHYDIVAEVEYGFEYQSVQEVFDFLISYQRYLTAVGFKFDEFDNDAESTLDWKHSGKEFIFWAQLATWGDGSFIALSPAANKIKLDSTALGNIASINEIINGTYAVLDKNGVAIDISNLEITRGNDELTINTVSGIGIYGLKINTFKSEHAIFFENKTGFNDLIYDPLFRLRQNRLKLNLTKTADWDGTVEAGGYIVSDSTIVPNFNTTANDYRKFFNNRDVPTSKAQRELARHLIGYQHRDYLTNLTGDEDTSYEFYKGMIRQKGSKESVKRLLRSDTVTNEESLTLYEEFALKLGDFGATRITTDNEILIKANDVKVQNPLIEFTYEPASVDSSTDDIIQLNNTNDNRWLRKPKTPVNEVWPKSAIGYKEISALPTAGYVHSDDITYRAYDVTALAALNTVAAATTEPLLNSIAHVAKGFNNEFSTHKLIDSGLKPEIIEAVDGSTTTSIVNITGQEIPSVTGALAIPATNIGDTIEVTFDDNPATKTTVTVSTAEPASVDDPNAIPLLNLELKTDVTSIAVNDSIYINTEPTGAGTLVTFDTAPTWKPVVVIGLQELPIIKTGKPFTTVSGSGGASVSASVIDGVLETTISTDITCSTTVQVGETIVQLNSGASGIVQDINGVGYNFKLVNVKGIFTTTDTVIGSVSGIHTALPTVIKNNGYKIITGGTGYTSPPALTIAPSPATSGTQATATSKISINFSTSASPPFTLLAVGETITQANSGATGVVSSITFDTNTNISLSAGTTILQKNTGAKGTVKSTVTNSTNIELENATGTFTTNVADTLYSSVNPQMTDVNITAFTNPFTATATSTLNAGEVESIEVSASGAGYAIAPVVTITGDGTNATATATIVAGIVTEITVTNAGSGYSTATVSIAPPVQNIQLTDVTGTFTGNDSADTLAGSASGNLSPVYPLSIVGGAITDISVTNGGTDYYTGIMSINGTELDFYEGDTLTTGTVSNLITNFSSVPNVTASVQDNKIKLSTPNQTLVIADQNTGIGRELGFEEGTYHTDILLNQVQAAILAANVPNLNVTKLSDTILKLTSNTSVLSVSHGVGPALDRLLFTDKNGFETHRVDTSKVTVDTIITDINAGVTKEDFLASKTAAGKIKLEYNGTSMAVGGTGLAGLGIAAQTLSVASSSVTKHDFQSGDVIVLKDVKKLDGSDAEIDGGYVVTDLSQTHSYNVKITASGMTITNKVTGGISAVANANAINLYDIVSADRDYIKDITLDIVQAIAPIEIKLGDTVTDNSILPSFIGFVEKYYGTEKLFSAPAGNITLKTVSNNNFTSGEFNLSFTIIKKGKFTIPVSVSEECQSASNIKWWRKRNFRTKTDVFNDVGSNRSYYELNDLVWVDNNPNGWLTSQHLDTNTHFGIDTLTIGSAGTGYTQGDLGATLSFATDTTTTKTAPTLTIDSIAYAVSKIDITNKGIGYTSPPTVTFDGGTPDTTAVGLAVLSSTVTGLSLTDNGGGYKEVPAITIASSQIYSGSTWNIAHNLGQKYLNVEISDSNNTACITKYHSPTITFVDANNLTVVWDSITTGTIDIIKSEAVSSLQSSANAWTFTHNLNTDIPNIDIIYDDDTVATGKYDHPLIEYTDANNVKVIFPTGVQKSGYIVATYSDGNATPSNGHTHTQSVAETTWVITHNLNKQICNIDIAVLGSNIVSSDYSEAINNTKYYNIKSNYNYPIITYINANTLTATFELPTVGKLSVSRGDGNIDTAATGSAHMTVDTDAVGCRGFNINAGGTGYTQGDTIVVAGGTETTKASATVSTIGGGGVVTGLTLINGGDYTVLPATPSNGIATTGGTGSNLTVDLNFKVASISLTEPGKFQITPEILIAAPTQVPAGGCTPSQAIATATLSGIVDEVQILSGGVNYTTLPTISFSGGGGAGAAATATLAGPVDAISISNIGDLIYNPTTTNVATTGTTDGTGLTISATYKDITNFDTWFKTYRAEENPINSKLFNVAKLYDKTEHTVDATMQLIDPPKGIISGLADTEIQYKLERDPARYTDSSDASFVHDTDETWGIKQLGQIWWDTSTVRFINAELGDNRYRRETWGELFPGSTIDIYEWVSSTVNPSSYTGTGIVFDSSRFCEIEVWNDNLNMFITTYFFWVKDVEIVPAVNFRARSAVDVRNYITNPTKQGINWYAPISHNYEWTEEIIISNTSMTQTIGLTVLATEISLVTINGVKVNWSQGTADVDGKINTIVLMSAPTVNDSLRIGYKRDGGAMVINNIDHLLTIDDSVLQLRYNTKPTESNVHKQWKLIRPSDPRSSIPPQFINKFIDSITGYDATGLVVPDSTILNDIEKHGTLTRPRQTWFKDLTTARKEFVTFMNTKLKPLALDDDRIAWDAGLTQTLITTEDWYAVKESTTSDEGITTYVYWDTDAVINYTVKTVTERNALTTVAINDIVKVTNAGNNRWKLYQFVGWGLLKSWVAIGSEKATRQFQETIYTSDLTVAQTTELRQIINALFNNVFIKDWFVYKNDIIFNMINYILAEQPEVDWIFKSTYATTTVTETDIAQKNKWKVDLLPSTESYLNEVKPYSTKFREVTGIKNIKLDTAKTHSTDFDNPPFKDTLGIFGTVNAVIPLQTSNPDHLPALQSGIYSDYFANKTDATKVRGLTVKMHFDRIHPTIEQTKTYILGGSEPYGVDSRPVKRTTSKNKEEREIALLKEIVSATSVGESSSTQIGGALHRILKYSPSGEISTIINSLVNAKLDVDTDIATHEIIIQNGLQGYAGITYSNLTSTIDTTDSYYTGQGLTIQEAVERYDYDSSSVLRIGTSGGTYPAPGPESEAQKKIKLFTNRIENVISTIKEKLYDEEGIFNDPKKLQIEDSNRFEVANAGEDTWGWDSDEWDRHEYSATESAEVPVRKWDDGGNLGNNYSEFKNYSLEKDTTGDKVPWHVHIPAIRGGIESVKYSTKHIYVQASGLPDHEFGPFPNANNPNKVKNQNALWKVPVEIVVPTATGKETPPMGPIAIARNGIVIYNPKSSSSYLSENIWHENAVTNETGIDNANGHTNEANQYHYHQNPIAIYDDESYAHSPLLGYAFDGVPIYGPRSFANVNSTGEIRRMRSSYRLKSGARTAIGSESIPPGNYDGKYIEDYEYVTNLGDLDEFNGRSAQTPEYPEGIYAYYITVDDLGASAYPYVIGPKYYAKPLAENFADTEKPTITESIAEKDIYLPNYSTDRDNRDSKNFIRPQYEQYPEEFVPVNPKEGLQITTETRSVLIEFVGGGPTRIASAYATVSGDAIASITVTDPGAGYTSVPTVRIKGIWVTSAGPEPSGATATATVTAGTISGVTVDAGGQDFDNINVSWKQYFDADGEKRIYALGDAQNTTIVGTLTKGTTEITVADVSKLPMPVKDTYYKGHAVPGVIFIGAERIEYYEVNHSTNKLLNCRRGTVTTTDENHTSGTKVYGITDSNTMAGNYETMWDPHSGSSGRGILNSSSHEARFLRLNKGAAIT